MQIVRLWIVDVAMPCAAFLLTVLQGLEAGNAIAFCVVFTSFILLEQYASVTSLQEATFLTSKVFFIILFTNKHL